MTGARFGKIRILLAYWEKGFQRNCLLCSEVETKKLEAVEIPSNEKIKDEQLKDEWLSCGER
jgi:hypothetical protein